MVYIYIYINRVHSFLQSCALDDVWQEGVRLRSGQRQGCTTGLVVTRGLENWELKKNKSQCHANGKRSFYPTQGYFIGVSVPKVGVYHVVCSEIWSFALDFQFLHPSGVFFFFYFMEWSYSYTNNIYIYMQCWLRCGKKLYKFLPTIISVWFSTLLLFNFVVVIRWLPHLGVLTDDAWRGHLFLYQLVHLLL